MKQKKFTIYDVADTAGVSPATVSRMIHQPDIVTEKTRRKILDAFAVLGISPEDLATKKSAASQTTGRHALQTPTVLVCVPNWSNPFYDDILEGIQDYLNRMRYHMIVTLEIPQRNTMSSFLNYCKNLQISGIIIMYPLSEDLLRQLNASYPVVQCSEYNPLYKHVPYVSIDDYTISKSVMTYLVDAGCEKIAFFSASFNYKHVQNRYRAYKAILSGNRMTMRPEYVVQVTGFSYNRILSAAEHFFRLSDPPDAIFCTSDQHAHAVIKAGQSLGFRIPEDVKVFGFDNTMYATLSTPAISTVVQPRRDLGIQSTSLLIGLIKNPHASKKPLLLPSKLLIREST